MRKQPDNSRPLLYVLFKKFGISGALRILHDDVGFDLLNRINTAAPVSCARLYPKGQRHNQNRYVASTFGVLEGVLKYTATKINPTDCGFVDLGSGKGKALIGAARYPFKSIKGVDISPMMHKIASRNLQKLSLSSRIELQLGSAADLDLLPHERVLYLFNSFTGEVLERCLEKISDCERNGPGILIYVNPTESEQVSRRFELIATEHLQPGNCEVSYFTLP